MFPLILSPQILNVSVPCPQCITVHITWLIHLSLCATSDSEVCAQLHLNHSSLSQHLSLKRCLQSVPLLHTVHTHLWKPRSYQPQCAVNEPNSYTEVGWIESTIPEISTGVGPMMHWVYLLRETTNAWALIERQSLSVSEDFPQVEAKIKRWSWHVM